CFSAGNDLADFLKPRRPDEESPATALFRTLPVMRKPVVAAVAGPAIGIGCTLLLHCDLVYAGENARFQLPFVPLGIVPEFGSTRRSAARSRRASPRRAASSPSGSPRRKPKRRCAPFSRCAKLEDARAAPRARRARVRRSLPVGGRG